MNPTIKGSAFELILAYPKNNSDSDCLLLLY